MIENLNERIIAFDKNIAEIDSVKFHFTSKDKGAVVFYKSSSRNKYPFIINSDNYALGFDSTLQLPVATQTSLKMKTNSVYILI